MSCSHTEGRDTHCHNRNTGRLSFNTYVPAAPVLGPPRRVLTGEVEAAKSQQMMIRIESTVTKKQKQGPLSGGLGARCVP
jgi:hypothetical protein